jgi:succinate dehydrogenase/fumarate reductase-like Fe-S protein
MGQDRRQLDSDFAAAFALAQKVTQTEQRRLLVKATARALEQENAHQIVAECEQLLRFWRSMPEHITGATAIRQLEAVVMGGRAPASSAAPR